MLLLYILFFNYIELLNSKIILLDDSSSFNIFSFSLVLLKHHSCKSLVIQNILNFFNFIKYIFLVAQVMSTRNIIVNFSYN